MTEASQSITLDLSATGQHYVVADSSGNEFTLDVSGNEMHDGYAGDSMSLHVEGEFGAVDGSGNPMDGVIDYIDFGDGENNIVTNHSEVGLAINFGTASSFGGNDSFTGSSLTESDLIDLRGINAQLSIADGDADSSGSSIQIDASALTLIFRQRTLTCSTSRNLTVAPRTLATAMCW